MEKQISKFWSDRSCGVIAACNTLYYMLEPETPSISKEDFIQRALVLYKFITPRVYGIPTVGVMRRGVERYAKTKKLHITSNSLVNPKELIETIDYIKNGLKKNAPIMMLTWNTKMHNLRYHWVTVTGYYMTRGNKHYVTISNYGKKEMVSINEWVEEKSIYKGLLYFILKKD